MTTIEPPNGAELLETIHAAWLAGYDTGHAHGRRDERTIVDQERRSARAGAIVANLARLPELDLVEQARIRLARNATRRRIMSERPGRLARKTRPATTAGKRTPLTRRGAA